MQTKNNFVQETSDVNGRRLHVKWISLGSIFRQVVLCRSGVNYLHFLWPQCFVLSILAVGRFFVTEKYLENVPNIWITVLTLSCIALSCLYSLMTDIIEESIQVIDGFGIQLSSKARLGKENKFFFDFTSIEGVIINEAITLQRVIFYLVLVINKKTLTQDKKPSESQEATQLITMFKHTLPRLDVIKDIYNEIQPFLKPNINDDLG